MDASLDSSDDVRKNIEFIILSITGNLRKRIVTKAEMSPCMWETMYLLKLEGAVEIGTFKGQPAIRVSKAYLDSFLNSENIENPWSSDS